MRLEKRQRSPFSSWTRLIGATAVLFLLHLAAPPKSSAVQIFIESAFVHQVNDECVVQNTVSGVPRFRCPPFSDDVCKGVTGSFCPHACAGCGGTGQSLLTVNGPGATPPDAASSINPTTGGSDGWGNVSNEPHIEFDKDTSVAGCNPDPSILPPGVVNNNVCNSKLFLCAAVGYGNNDSGTSSTDVAIDNLQFEIFKFQDGSNPLDPGSTPPQRTFFVDSPGKLIGGCTSADPGSTGTNGETCEGPLGPFCVLWDGSINLKGEFGKTNGQYGFRAQAMTNQTGASGNIQITAVRAYPSGATRDGQTAASPVGCGSPGCVVSQKPIVVDVTNVHVVRSSPTTVGKISPVPVQPYLLSYRLSKDATMFITIENSSGTEVLRHVLPGIARVGEGAPDGSLANGDSWNGRGDNGDLMPPGVYMAHFWAVTDDLYGFDQSQDVYRQISLDPLQITDIQVQPLFEGSTSLAVLSYQLSEPATVYIDIYPPGTQFCGDTNGDGINAVNVNTDVEDDASAGHPPKKFYPTLDGDCSNAAADSILPLREIVEQKSSRIPVTSFWDGRDANGNVLADGDYVFVIYADLPSQNGFQWPGPPAPQPAPGTPGDKRIWTSQAKSGFLTISRGMVGISQISIASSVMGSSPSVAGLNPFLFRYSLSRDAIVNLKIYDANGKNVVRTIVNNEIRPGLFANQERWDDGLTDAGLVVDSGTYLAQLTATDPQFPAKVSTTTAMFSINLFRITDVNTTPLLSGASDVILLNYQLSQSMFIGWNIYPPGTVIHNAATSWPPCASQGPAPGTCADITDPNGNPVHPVFQLKGLRVGRLRITDQWDGRDPNGLLVPDGNYVYYLAAQSTQTASGGQPPQFASDRIVGTLAVQRGQIIFPTFSVDPDVEKLVHSSDTILLDPFSINYSLTRQSSVTIQILNTLTPPSVVRTLFAGQVKDANIALTDVWDGRDDNGNFPPPGFYNVRAVATDIAAQNSGLSVSTAQVTISYDPLRIYDVAVTPIVRGAPGAEIDYQVSEPMKVSIKIYKPGTTFDGAGNPSPPEKFSLVKRIVEIKESREPVSSVWDGTDLRLSRVPDGTYKYRIVGSTDINAIDSVSGDVLDPSALAEDRVIDDLPVVRNGTDNPATDFVDNTFAFPNPATSPTVTFQIYLPEQGKVTLKIHNIAGDLVLEKDFPEMAASWASQPLEWVWNKTNQSGRAVARGMYFAVIHFESTLGGKNVLQTVKTVLLP